MEWEKFIAEYKTYIHRQVMVRVPAIDVADVEQDIWEHITKSLSTFKGKSSLMTWLSRLIRNRIAVYYRQRSRLMDSHTELTLEGILPEGWRLPMVRRDVRDAVEGIPQSYMEVIVLHFWHDMSFTEIAQYLHLNYEAVRSRYRRGIKCCRKNPDCYAGLIEERDIETQWTGTEVRVGRKV